MNLFDNNSGAEFSKCGKYRYKLWRIWDESLPKVMCIGLNPSTANSETNDPTIFHLTIALKKLGYGGFYMMNLFAWISSKPKYLLTCEDPLGDNDGKLQEVETICNDVIVCWGNHNKKLQNRVNEILAFYPNAKCFGVNKNKTPFHPLALMYKGIKNPNLFIYKSASSIL